MDFFLFYNLVRKKFGIFIPRKWYFCCIEKAWATIRRNVENFVCVNSFSLYLLFQNLVWKKMISLNQFVCTKSIFFLFCIFGFIKVWLFWCFYKWEAIFFSKLYETFFKKIFTIKELSIDFNIWQIWIAYSGSRSIILKAVPG